MPQNQIEPQAAASTYKNLVNNSMYTLSTTPTVGECNILVIPVWFTNSNSFIQTAYRNKVKEDIEKAYFGTNEETGWRSAKTYYEEESHGALTYNGVVSDWYECGDSSSVYANDGDATTSLVKKASDWYFTQNPSANRRNFDKDSDGYLDGVMLIYAAPDQQAAHNNNSNFWAYCYWVQDSSANSVLNPGANAFFWASYDFMYGSNKVSARTGIPNGYHGGDTRYCNIDTHTFIHEMGHMFGLTDYYDYSGQYNPAGGFSMQDCNVGGHDPFSSFALGWGKAYIPGESMTINLKPFATSGEMILLTPQFNSYGSPFDEYILLEYYTPTALNEFDSTYLYQNNNNYPKGTQEVGIRVWHVDARLYYYKSGYSGSFSLTTNPNIRNHNVDVAMSNTYPGGSSDSQGYLSRLGSGYYYYNILQQIRNNTSVDYKPTDSLSTNSLFRMGSSFSMSKYSKQFYKSGKLNQNIDLGFTFTVDNTVADYATITVTKA